MSLNSFSSVIRVSALSLVAVAVLGCASEPTLDTSPDAVLSFDGLAPVKGGRMDAAWAKPGFDIEPYSKVMLKGVGVEYRPGGETGRTYYSKSQGGHFEVTPEQKERFETIMGEAFREEMAKGKNFEIVDEPGPDVLLIVGGLLDVVSYIPPEPVGSGNIYLSRVGEATLVLEIRDSTTNAMIIRAIDRRAAEDSTGGFSQSNRVTNTAEFRRVAIAWARILREGLDRFMAAGDAAGE